ncbi:Aromatic/aminoadipate aminotransferase 1 [Podospora pseudopauciseta]|uniref:Aromatic/aminoadipate aminotransferase 1 n=1 Tax=Podospora pseudopauciseta TaxID=2093780 RepID=A0ABR0HZ21_9PEZI|nr:Aromatic/aminoadipate aminotransferase 1 [Podospora pseudopauciseta]
MRRAARLGSGAAAVVPRSRSWGLTSRPGFIKNYKKAQSNNGQQASFHSRPKLDSAAEATVIGGPSPLPEVELPDIPETPTKNKRVTIGEILERRRRAGRLVAPTAAGCDSGVFKGDSSGKPMAKDMSHHLSYEASIREPCKLKQAARHLKTPGIISLGGGLPCPEYFPINSISLSVPDYLHNPTLSPPEVHPTFQDITIGKYDTHPSAPVQKEYDLSISLNYAQAHGSAQLIRFVTEHTELVSNPPYADWKTCLTVGSTGALEQTLRMLCDSSRNDSILTEEFSFATALETAHPLGIPTFGVPIDEQGLIPSELDHILSTWSPSERDNKRKPHVLYTVPSGQNPTGATQGPERRRQIYDICSKHDLVIIEDEPYYYLQLPPTITPTPTTAPSNTTDFLDSLLPTLLSMDTDGRVIRMDSFSKVLVPGSRLGWLTASDQLVERFLRHAEVANQGPSGFSQVILHKLLDETWGHEGYLKWLMVLQREYTERRNTLLKACEEYLPKEVVSWGVVRAGMFQWLHLDHTLHPDSRTKSILEIEEEIFESCIDKGVLIARGSWFRAQQELAPTGLFFRATFAAATPGNMTEAIRRLGGAVRESFRL